jgi:hypothetical protein
MNTNQIQNLLEFSAIFLSGDLKITQESPDYFREKYDKYIGILPFKHHEATPTYKEWTKIWGEYDEINTILIYFMGVVKCFREKHKDDWTGGKHWLTQITPSDLIDTFEKYIGKVDEINTKRYTNVHPLIKQKIYDVYIKENKRFFKFLRILNENDERNLHEML